MGDFRHQITFKVASPREWGLPKVTVRIFRSRALFEKHIKKLWPQCGEIGAAATLVPASKDWIEVLFCAEEVSFEYIIHELSHASDYLTDWVGPPIEHEDLWDQGEWKAMVIGVLSQEFMVKFSKYFEVTF